MAYEEDTKPEAPRSPVVHLFLDTGRTFTFRNATIETDNESVLVIGYTAASDHRYKQATIRKEAIVGWSVAP